MSIEAQISISAAFADEDAAKVATSQLKKSLTKNEHELASALHQINPVENQEAYERDTINVENISRKKKILSIYAYSYSSEEPTWFAKSFGELGAKKLFIRGVWDGHARNFYFLDGIKVTKKKYDGDKPKKPLSAKDIEINKNLFLPEGRVLVKATLDSHWDVGDIYESTGMAFTTDDGIKFYHQGKGELTRLISDEYIDTVEFYAAFERGKLDGKYVSFAKRPTKVKLTPESDELSGTDSEPPPQRGAPFNTKAKCPFCGSSLRTEKAKQCPSCFESWSGAQS